MISDHVVDLPTSKKLAPYLNGRESEYIYTRYRIKLAMGDWDNWSEMELIPYESYKASPDFVQREVYPALLLSEVLEKLPNIIEVRPETWVRILYQGCVGYYIFDTYNIFITRKQYNIEKHGYATAAAELLLYLYENGYMEGK